MIAAILVMALGAVLLGAALGYAAVRFRVEGDPLVEKIDAILPQTQCGQCGFPGCKPYAQAIAKGEAEINQCPPGGDEGIHKLADLLGRLGEARATLRAGSGDVPIFLKIAPDLADDEIQAIVETAVAHGLEGLIVGNTTLSRPSDLRGAARGETGGLSGGPLMALSTAVLARVRQAAGDRLALIGVGGIASGADAYAKIRAGASAVQLYSAMVYQGPGLIPRIRRDLAARLAADGFANVAEAVGTAGR